MISHLLIRTRRVGLAVTIASSAVVVGCSGDAPTAPAAPRGAASAAASAQDETVRGPGVSLLKISPVVGTFSFHISVSGGGEYWLGHGADPTVTFATPQDVLDGKALEVWFPMNPASWPAGKVQILTICEKKIPAGLAVSVINVTINGTMRPYIGTPCIIIPVRFTDNVQITFVNVKPTTACGGIYFKQSTHLAAWSAAGLSPNAPIESEFVNADNPAFKLKGKTLGEGYSLLSGLDFRGNTSTEGAAELLLRIAIASDLNSRHPATKNGYMYSTSTVQTVVNNALATKSRAVMLVVAALLEIANYRGSCPLR